MTPNQLPPLSDEQMDSIFADWLDAACLIHQEGSDTIEPAPQTHLHKNDVVQLMRVVESAALAALAQQAQEPVAWLYVDTVGERYLCFSRPTGGGVITNLYTTPPSPQPAVPVVSDEQIRKTVESIQDPDTVHAFHNGYYTLTPNELRRTILAMRPAVEPMTPFTPSQRMRLWQNTEKGKSATSLGAFERICRTVEAAHRIGITAKAEDAHQPTKEAEK